MSAVHTSLNRRPASPEIRARFPDLHPAFDAQAALPEANRCLFCFDAPCMAACPTHIDVPRFIKKIATGNLEGAAHTILDANILGESCSRACPVSVLCEGACVLHRYNRKPIEIGRLQRFAMDELHASGASLPFEPGADTGKTVALIGGGPASLACAAELRRRGIAAHIYDARPLPGGLNTYGIAEYKLTLDASLREIAMLSQLGVNFHPETPVDEKLLAKLQATSDAIFLGIGLGAIHQLGLPGDNLGGITNALDFIAAYKTGKLTSISGSVAVIGAGNTAIDAANAARRLGAQKVIIIYRRGPAEMSAFEFEYQHARQEGVDFLFHSQAVRFVGEQNVEQIELQTRKFDVPETFSTATLAVDLVISAIGQMTHAHPLLSLAKVKLDCGRIVIDRATGQTSQPRIFAGGDCTNGGREVVDAVADGKRAAIGIAAWLGTQMGDAKHAHA